MDLVVNSHNFKVRINSALALSVPEKKIYYREYYFHVWKALLDALDNSQNIEDFSEYKHRDNLIDQVCLNEKPFSFFPSNCILLLFLGMFITESSNYIFSN